MFCVRPLRMNYVRIKSNNHCLGLSLKLFLMFLHTAFTDELCTESNRERLAVNGVSALSN